MRLGWAAPLLVPVTLLRCLRWLHALFTSSVISGFFTAWWSQRCTGMTAKAFKFLMFRTISQTTSYLCVQPAESISPDVHALKGQHADLCLEGGSAHDVDAHVFTTVCALITTANTEGKYIPTKTSKRLSWPWHLASASTLWPAFSLHAAKVLTTAHLGPWAPEWKDYYAPSIFPESFPLCEEQEAQKPHWGVTPRTPSQSRAANPPSPGAALSLGRPDLLSVCDLHSLLGSAVDFTKHLSCTIKYGSGFHLKISLRLLPIWGEQMPF